MKEVQDMVPSNIKILGLNDINCHEEIIEDGLTPGAENDAETGESSEYEDVCFSTSYPIALRYAELTEANKHIRSTDLENTSIGSFNSPMVIEIPVQSFESVKVDKRNADAINKVLGADIDRYERAMVSEVCEDGPEEEYQLSEFIDYNEN